MPRLENKVAIITGGGAGLGRAYATVFTREGAGIAIFEYDDEIGQQTAASLRETGADVRAYHVDVSDEDAVDSTVNKVAAEFGRIDILVNNAQSTDRSTPPGPLEHTTTSQMRVTWETGALGTFLCGRAVVPHMKKNGYGRIINTGSASGLEGMQTFTADGSQKEAIRSMTKTWARELGRFGITSNVILPGALTEAARRWRLTNPEEYERSLEPQPVGMLGDPETDIAPLVLFLASEEAGFITGQTIGVDGGTTMH